MTSVITIDFETKPIEDRPSYPPEPVGVAIKYDNEPGKYMAWGHAAGENNATQDEARSELAQAMGSGADLLFHDAYFDLSVIHEFFGMELPHWRRVHDTAILAFLRDPHARSHGLKELAEQHLNWPPAERDAIGDWAWEHRVRIKEEFGIKATRSRSKRDNQLHITKVWQYYWIAPGGLAGKYAIGDVDRTYGLFKAWIKDIADMSMMGAYDREREVAPIFYQNERDGMRVDHEKLSTDVAIYSDLMEYVEEQFCERLGISHLNFDNDGDMAEALSSAGIVKDEDWVLTKSGQRSVSKDNLKINHFQDPQVYHVLGYRNRLKTALDMFMRTWLKQADATGGRIHTHWNTTRGADGGTRTGRPSSYKPNILNISKDFEDNFVGWEHPEFLLGDQTLPLVREYVIADHDDDIICHRDFNGQELRVFAEYECGPLKAEYLKNPALDVHQLVSDKVSSLFPDVTLNRHRTKIINFRKIYGGGPKSFMDDLGVSYDEAKQFGNYHAAALPGHKVLVDTITRLARRGIPIRTWGGRMYLPEPPAKIDGRWVDFCYKLINYLIQGSAADITKQAMIDWHNHPDREARFLLQVYDELNINVHSSKAVAQMAILKEVMERPRLDVPMLSEGKHGFSWGHLTKGDPV